MYEYTDDDNDSLHVESSIVFGQTYVGTVQDDGPATGVLIHNEDAPAIALAILEAAGINPDVDPTTPEAFAVMHLAKWRHAQAEKAEREAEDARALAFRKVIFPGIRPGASITPKDRDLYNAARKFFEES